MVPQIMHQPRYEKFKSGVDPTTHCLFYDTVAPGPTMHVPQQMKFFLNTCKLLRFLTQLVPSIWKGLLWFKENQN